MRVQSHACCTVLTLVGIGLRLDLRRKGLEAGRLDDEVGAARHGRRCGVFTKPVPPANRRSFGPLAQLANALDEAVAFGHGIERGRRAQLQRELAPVLDRIDDDDLAGAGDAAGLHRAESDRAGAEDDDVAAGLEMQPALARGEARRQLIAEQGELAPPAGR